MHRCDFLDWLGDPEDVALDCSSTYEYGELKQAARTGLQNYVNSDTPAHAAYYYHQGTRGVAWLDERGAL